MLANETSADVEIQQRQSTISQRGKILNEIRQKATKNTAVHEIIDNDNDGHTSPAFVQTISAACNKIRSRSISNAIRRR